MSDDITTPVDVQPHECEGGAAVCGHRGMDFINKDTGEVVHSQPVGDVNEQDQ